jgi:hypothetical protein
MPFTMIRNGGLHWIFYEIWVQVNILGSDLFEMDIIKLHLE